MANSYFQFREFCIHQDKSAMKVCTDSCLFGAWVAEQISVDTTVRHILDIGTGTGLLSLMLAQKTTAHIHSIDIDKDSVDQCRRNIQESPWSNRMQVEQTAVQDFKAAQAFQVIICNPPFFDQDLLSPDQRKSLAKHSISLGFQDICAAISRHLDKEGRAFLLIPYHRTEDMISIAKQAGLHVSTITFVRQTPVRHYFRTMMSLNKRACGNAEMSDLSIHDDQRNYTEPFKELLKDYYLKL